MPKHASPKRFSRIFAGLFENIFLLLGITFVVWGLEFVDSVIGNRLDGFGIQPRKKDSLMGIATAHWLHGGFKHVFSNTFPFWILGGFVLLGGKSMFWKVSLFVGGLGGLALWAFGEKGTNHIGASLVIFGYLGFLLARGIFEKSLPWIIVSMITLFIYWSMLFGMIPGQAGISWEGHLFGFLSGVLAARILVPRHKSIYHIPHVR